ncbi:hypothetical protein [Stenotrophomonas maltophilia]|uniref:hypothetical protein n=1 Tax=Stenotrophomonas maltophilia TaxID=40324 RepID=UPI004041CF41
MSNPAELFANVVDQTIAASHQFNETASIDEKSKRRKTTRMSKDGSGANDVSNETKLALEVMRRENAEARADLKTTISTFQAENALFRETVRGFITSAQVENAQFREQFRDGVASIKTDMAKHSSDIESKISNLKIWVLTGAVSALVTTLGLAGNALIRKENSAGAAPSQLSTVAPPAQPSVQVSVSGTVSPDLGKPQRAVQVSQHVHSQQTSTSQTPPPPAKP